MTHPDRTKLYLIVWAVLFALTVGEVAVSGLSLGPAVILGALIVLSVAKAVCVGLFYMHLRWERVLLGLLALSPFLWTALYSIVLILENASP